MVLTLVTIVVCLGMGRVTLAPGRVLAVFLAGVGIGGPVEALERSIVLSVRLPRTLLAALSGAGLAVAGAALQGCLRNPLVGPQNVGVLSGAGFGGTMGLFLAWGPFGVAAAAFIGGLAAMLLVLWLGRSAGQMTVLMLVLAGIVVSALCIALDHPGAIPRGPGAPTPRTGVLAHGQLRNGHDVQSGAGAGSGGTWDARPHRAGLSLEHPGEWGGRSARPRGPVARDRTLSCAPSPPFVRPWWQWLG